MSLEALKMKKHVVSENKPSWFLPNILDKRIGREGLTFHIEIDRKWAKMSLEALTYFEKGLMYVRINLHDS